MTTGDYAVVILAPNDAPVAAFGAALRRAFAALDLSAHLTLHTEATFDTSVAPASCAAVYFGGPKRDDACTQLAVRFVRNNAFILPIVERLDGYPDQVPTALRGVNGVVSEAPDFADAINYVLAGLGVVRHRRRIFISYRRKESRGVARQLATRLVERGYLPFLDTWSVEGGRMFQTALWDRMADTDQVVFLDTPGAFESRWVVAEFARANELGIEVLHLMWPGREPNRGTAMAERLYLKTSDFLGRTPNLGPSGRLRAPALARAVDRIETLRARTWGARRAKVVGNFLRGVRSRRPKQMPTGEIRLEAPEGVVLPVLGTPRSQDFEAAAHLGAPAWVLYDARGVAPTRRQHIAWLDNHLPARALALQEVSSWPSSP